VSTFRYVDTIIAEPAPQYQMSSMDRLRFFFVCDQLRGPPFGILPDQLAALLTPTFECLEDAPVEDSLPVFAGRERWQVWRRKAT
jgi:hypothetical protein